MSKNFEKRHKSVLKNRTKFYEIASERVVRFVNILNNSVFQIITSGKFTVGFPLIIQLLKVSNKDARTTCKNIPLAYSLLTLNIWKYVYP